MSVAIVSKWPTVGLCYSLLIVSFLQLTSNADSHAEKREEKIDGYDN